MSEILARRIAQLESGELERRLEALEKNCHEPQEIEPRVIRALLKFGIVKRDGLGLWSVAPSWFNRVSHPELFDAQVGVADDAASPPTDGKHNPNPANARFSPLETVTGEALDRLAALHELDPPRCHGEADDSVRTRLKGWVGFDRIARAIPMIFPADGSTAFDRQESLDEGGVADDEFPAPIVERRNGEEYRAPQNIADVGFRFAPSTDFRADISAPAQPNEFRRRLRESLSEDPDPDGFEAFIRDFEAGTIKAANVKIIPIGEFPRRPGSMVGTEPSAELMVARWNELANRDNSLLIDDLTDFARWYHGYRCTGAGKPA